MRKIRHNKLVRDRIPEMIEAAGKKCTTLTLSEEDYARFLDKKLYEEFQEYQDCKCMEELADVLEVIHAIVRARGSTLEELEQMRLRKKQSHGGFENKILLMEVMGEA